MIKNRLKGICYTLVMALIPFVNALYPQSG